MCVASDRQFWFSCMRTSLGVAGGKVCLLSLLSGKKNIWRNAAGVNGDVM